MPRREKFRAISLCAQNLGKVQGETSISTDTRHCTAQRKWHWGSELGYWGSSSATGGLKRLCSMQPYKGQLALFFSYSDVSFHHTWLTCYYLVDCLDLLPKKSLHSSDTSALSGYHLHTEKQTDKNSQGEERSWTCKEETRFISLIVFFPKLYSPEHLQGKEIFTLDSLWVDILRKVRKTLRWRHFCMSFTSGWQSNNASNLRGA